MADYGFGIADRVPDYGFPGDWIGSVVDICTGASVMSCATFPMDNSSKTLLTQVVGIIVIIFNDNNY